MLVLKAAEYMSKSEAVIRLEDNLVSYRTAKQASETGRSACKMEMRNHRIGACLIYLTVF